MKTCTKCGKTKDFSEFYPNIKTKDGYRSACKKCTLIRKKELNSNLEMQLLKEIRKSVLVENSILIKQGKRLCSVCKKPFLILNAEVYTCKECLRERARNREYDKLYRKNYNEKNKEILKEKSKKYYYKNRDKMIEDAQKWRIENRDKFNECKRKYRLKKKLEKEQQKVLSK